MNRDNDRPPIWWRSERGSRGPDPTLDRQVIADTAVALADTGGLAAVSMRAVAGRLDTSASALYRYVDHRLDLLDLMADRVVAELRPFPAPTTDWLEPMVTLARGQRSLNERHPWLISIGHRSAMLGPESLAYFNACLSVLKSTRAPARAKFEAIALMTGLAALFAQQARGGTSGDVAAFPLIALESFPHLAEAIAEPSVPPVRDDLFDRAVRSLLRGLLEP